jgi:hypothetical protein
LEVLPKAPLEAAPDTDEVLSAPCPFFLDRRGGLAADATKLGNSLRRILRF